MVDNFNNLSTIKLKFLDIYPSLDEIESENDKITVYFESIDEIFELSSLIKEKQMIIFNKYKVPILINLIKSGEIFASGTFNPKNGEQWITINYGTKKKQINVNLALSLIDCIKIKLICIMNNSQNICSTSTIQTSKAHGTSFQHQNNSLTTIQKPIKTTQSFIKHNISSLSNTTNVNNSKCNIRRSPIKNKINVSHYLNTEFNTHNTNATINDLKSNFFNKRTHSKNLIYKHDVGHNINNLNNMNNLNNNTNGQNSKRNFSLCTDPVKKEKNQSPSTIQVKTPCNNSIMLKGCTFKRNVFATKRNDGSSAFLTVSKNKNFVSSITLRDKKDLEKFNGNINNIENLNVNINMSNNDLIINGYNPNQNKKSKVLKKSKEIINSDNKDYSCISPKDNLDTKYLQKEINISKTNFNSTRNTAEKPNATKIKIKEVNFKENNENERKSYKNNNNNTKIKVSLDYSKRNVRLGGLKNKRSIDVKNKSDIYNKITNENKNDSINIEKQEYENNHNISNFLMDNNFNRSNILLERNSISKSEDNFGDYNKNIVPEKLVDDFDEIKDIQKEINDNDNNMSKEINNKEENKGDNEDNFSNENKNDNNNNNNNNENKDIKNEDNEDCNNSNCSEVNNFTKSKDDLFLLYTDDYVSNIKDDMLNLETELFIEKAQELINEYHNQITEKNLEFLIEKISYNNCIKKLTLLNKLKNKLELIKMNYNLKNTIPTDYDKSLLLQNKTYINTNVKEFEIFNNLINNKNYKNDEDEKIKKYFKMIFYIIIEQPNNFEILNNSQKNLIKEKHLFKLKKVNNGDNHIEADKPRIKKIPKQQKTKVTSSNKQLNYSNLKTIDNADLLQKYEFDDSIMRTYKKKGVNCLIKD